MCMNTLVPYNSALPQYSSARSTYGGRLVDATAVTTGAQAMALTDPNLYAGWRYPVGSKPVLAGGTAVVRLWVAGATGAVSNPKLGVTLFYCHR